MKSGSSAPKGQDRQCTYVILRRVHESIVAVET